MISTGWSVCCPNKRVFVATSDDVPVTRHPPSRIRKIPLAFFLFFLLLFLAGIAFDEPSRVLEQARSVCLECIGIG